MTITVELTIEERNFVGQVGLLRSEANKHKNNIADYDTKRFNLTGLQANRLGVFAEAVAFKALGGNVLDHSLEEWAHFVPNDHPNYYSLIKEQADLFGEVEVRRANRLGNPIPIRSKDRLNANYVIQVHVPYTQDKRNDSNPEPLIYVGLQAQVTGWAKTTDTGTVPSWAYNNSTQVVTPRDMSTFPLLGVKA